MPTRIAFLNPWTDAAENQAARSLALAAAELGVEFVETSSPEEVEECRPAFVLSASSSVPKAVNFPSYLTVHEPSRRFRENRFYLENFLSYDGYLTISDSLARFVRDVCFGVGRVEEPGFYYNSPQAVSVRADLPTVVSRGELRLVYIGTNWDRRRPSFLRALDSAGYLRIHGPLHSWQGEGYDGYGGPLPFDGEAPQRAYAESGIGLVLLSEDHMHEDVVSNRIFEISSVGAVAVCPDIPWIRKWFDDSVLYLPRDGTTREWLDAVARHYAWCRDEPVSAQEMASRATVVFEQSFAADRMLTNLLAYHERKQARPRSRDRASQPEISVIVRCGGRSIDMVATAVRSIAQQTFGRFTVILSKYDEIDLSSITSREQGAIVGWKEVNTPRGSRVHTLFDALQRVTTEYFAILDDDDFWLDDHVETLFNATRFAGEDFDVAFSGSVCVSATPVEIEKNVRWYRNVYTFGFRSEPESVADVTREFASNCFVARTELISDLLVEAPDLRSAEDSLVVALACRRKRPVFSYKPTAFFRRGWEGESAYATDPSRAGDVMTVLIRSGLLLAPQWLALSSVPSSAYLVVPRSIGPVEDGAPELDPVDELRAELRAILQSRWWRVGRPVRYVRRLQLNVTASAAPRAHSERLAAQRIHEDDAVADLRARLQSVLESRWWRLGRPVRYLSTLGKRSFIAGRSALGSHRRVE